MRRPRSLEWHRGSARAEVKASATLRRYNRSRFDFAEKEALDRRRKMRFIQAHGHPAAVGILALLAAAAAGVVFYFWWAVRGKKQASGSGPPTR